MIVRFTMGVVTGASPADINKANHVPSFMVA
jgi:hypothetical protein